MNWLAQIQGILGIFWTRVWKDLALIDGVVALFSTGLGRTCYAAVQNIKKSTAVDASPRMLSAMPVAILIPIAGVRKTYTSVTDIVFGQSILQTAVAGNSWTAAVTGLSGKPLMLGNKAINATVNMVQGYDFDWLDTDTLTFYHDLAGLDVSSTTITAADGTLQLCYRLWAFYQDALPDRDIFTAIMGDSGRVLRQNRDALTAAWRLRHKGATPYNIKALIGTVTQLPVAGADGTVTAIFAQQEYNYIMVDDTIYRANKDATTSLSAGDTVSKGDALFGKPTLYTWKDTLPDTQTMPGIPVLTNQGILTAPNQSKAVVTSGVLPLTGSAGTVTAYTVACQAATADTAIPYCAVTSPINAAQFLLGTACSPSLSVLSLTNVNQAELRAAVQIIQDNMDSGSMLSIVAQPVPAYPLQVDLTTGAQAVGYYAATGIEQLTTVVGD